MRSTSGLGKLETVLLKVSESPYTTAISNTVLKIMTMVFSSLFVSSLSHKSDTRKGGGGQVLGRKRQVELKGKD